MDATIHFIGWTKHDGGKCPLPKDTFVEVRDVRGEIWRGVAGMFRWTSYPGLPDIAAYRLFQ
jgi:hypothetical protein